MTRDTRAARGGQERRALPVALAGRGWSAPISTCSAGVEERGVDAVAVDVEGVRVRQATRRAPRRRPGGRLDAHEARPEREAALRDRVVELPGAPAARSVPQRRRGQCVGRPRTASRPGGSPLQRPLGVAAGSRVARGWPPSDGRVDRLDGGRRPRAGRAPAGTRRASRPTARRCRAPPRRRGPCPRSRRRGTGWCRGYVVVEVGEAGRRGRPPRAAAPRARGGRAGGVVPCPGRRPPARRRRAASSQRRSRCPRVRGQRTCAADGRGPPPSPVRAADVERPERAEQHARSSSMRRRLGTQTPARPRRAGTRRPRRRAPGAGSPRGTCRSRRRPGG